MDTIFLILRVTVALAAVLGLIWVIQRRLMRGRAMGRHSATVAVVGRQSLGQKASVAVVDVEGARLVLGVTERGITVLHTTEAPRLLEALDAPAVPDALDAPAAPLALAPHPADFAAALRSARGSGRRSAQAPASGRRAHAATPAAASPLAGSILSPATWRTAVAWIRRVA
ncbi:MAG: flagellar biosynthetic protein FliO [Microbacteriaceae bacterium]